MAKVRAIALCFNGRGNERRRECEIVSWLPLESYAVVRYPGFNRAYIKRKDRLELIGAGNAFRRPPSGYPGTSVAVHKGRTTNDRAA